MSKKKNKKKDIKLLPVYEDIIEEIDEIVHLLYKLKATYLDGKSEDFEAFRKEVIGQILSQVIYSLKATLDKDEVDNLGINLILMHLFKANKRGFLRVPLSLFSKITDEKTRNEIFFWYRNLTMRYAELVKGLIAQKDTLTEDDIKNIIENTPILLDFNANAIVNSIKDQANPNENKFNVVISIQGASSDLTQVIADIIKDFLLKLDFQVSNLQAFEQTFMFTIRFK